MTGMKAPPQEKRELSHGSGCDGETACEDPSSCSFQCYAPSTGAAANRNTECEYLTKSSQRDAPLHVILSGMLLKVYTWRMVILLGTGLESAQYYSSAFNRVERGQILQSASPVAVLWVSCF